MSRRRGGGRYAWTALFALIVTTLVWVARDNMKPVGVGTRAPNFTYTNLQGDTVSLDDYRGQIVLVNVWATWCGPCRMEMPSMQRLYDLTEREDLEILAVSIDANPGQRDAGGNRGGDVAMFVDSLGLDFPILLNPNGDIQRAYQTTGVPETFLVGPDGVIRRKVAGGTEWDDEAYLEQIERLVSEIRAEG